MFIAAHCEESIFDQNEKWKSLAKMSSDQIQYSEKYFDNQYEYRWVCSPYIQSLAFSTQQKTHVILFEYSIADTLYCQMN